MRNLIFLLALLPGCGVEYGSFRADLFKKQVDVHCTKCGYHTTVSEIDNEAFGNTLGAVSFAATGNPAGLLASAGVKITEKVSTVGERMLTVPVDAVTTITNLGK